MNEKKYQLCKIFYRYEPEVEDGVLFMFNKVTGEMLEGNYSTYIVLQKIEEQKEIGQIQKEIQANFPNQDEKLIVAFLEELLKELIDSGFIQEVK